MNKKLSVTIGIPAKNEELTITGMLQSIMEQKQVTYVIDKIIVICDGCTDNTYSVVKQFADKHDVITIIQGDTSLGKAKRLNQLFRLNTSEIVVMFDADCKLAHPRVLQDLISAFKNIHVGLAGGRDIIFPPKSFFGKINQSTQEMWYEVRKDLNKGDSIHNCNGLALAIRKTFADTVNFPDGLTVDAKYLYLFAKESGWKYKFVPSARVYTRLADNFDDFMKQNVRFISGRELVQKYFQRDITQEYYVPPARKIGAILRTLIRYPFTLPVAFAFQGAIRLHKVLNPPDLEHNMWARIASTKI